METLLFSFLSAFVLALVLVPLCRRVAFSIGKVALPAVDRWHRQATPLFGGVAISIATMVCAIAFSDVASLVVPLSLSLIHI